MTRKETARRCADFFFNVYEALDGTHDENVVVLGELLGGDDYNARRALQAWMSLAPRKLLEFQRRGQDDQGLLKWLESVID